MSYDDVVNTLIECPDIIAIALGGSRAIGCHQINSDYDLFCVIQDNSFSYFRNSFCRYLEDIPSILLAAEACYLENWGYLFKAIGTDHISFDISIIPQSRISEMGVRSTNIVIKDSGGFYQACIDCANDALFLVSKIETQHFRDYSALFGFESKRFSEAIGQSDYWYAIRCLERMKNYLIRCDRIQHQNFSKTCSCPEKEYPDINERIKTAYIIDGSIASLVQTAERLCALFSNIIYDKEIIMRSQLLCQK